MYNIIFLGLFKMEDTYMKNSKKNAATIKKAYQAALIKKATAKKANAIPVVDSVKTDNISTTADTVPMRKVNDKALQDALAYLLSNYPAIEASRKSNFKDVFNMLLKLNVDLTSKKDIPKESERILNILGFTNSNHTVTKEFIYRDDIPQLVTFMFNGYQEKHPDFCKIDPSVLLNCADELDAISKKFWHPVVMYIACINASRMDPSNASKLLSGNEAEIESVFNNFKCSTYTRSLLIDLAPELGHMLQRLNNSDSNQENDGKPNGGYTPFAGLNPADFPAHIDGEQTADDSSNNIQDKEPVEGKPDEEAITEPVMQEQQPTVEVTPLEQTENPQVENSIANRQIQNLQTLKQAVDAIKQYGDILRLFDNQGFSIIDAQSLIETLLETERIGFSIHEMLIDKTFFERICEFVTALS